ncbi:MAG: hypothetical protein CVU40_07115 [Chloroflexi bacterium HGW-Chloroflexi-2]|nr:MAG: hypothetical protein CVU40_07115 [Chloroflexi bacterium HGW-Chloroflexi-2]
MTHRITPELRLLMFEHHDYCSSCGYKFKEGDTSHSGYSKNDEPLYVCDDCDHLLEETAVRNVFMPRFYEIPPDKCKLWRYMDFTKFVSMLSMKGLYFARADCFQDIYEGAKGTLKNKSKWDQFYLSFFKELIMNPPDGSEVTYTDEEIESQAEKLLHDLEKGGINGKKRTFINCWHENENESEAMWRLYSSYLENAIAIRTTYKSLYESLGRNPSIKIGRVKYIDYQKNFAGVNDSFWCKRNSFEHEKEVRAIILDMHHLEKGKVIPCDLSQLLEEVFISPNAPNWFGELVNDVIDKYGLSIKVSPSELIQEPFF